MCLDFLGTPHHNKVVKTEYQCNTLVIDGAENGDQKTSSKMLEVLLTECEDC